MSVSVIEGRVLEAPIKVRRKAFVRFTHIAFEHPDGRTERIAKVVTSNEIADCIAPGAEGRFYMFKTLDVGGMAGVRLTDGTERYAFPGNNLMAFGITILVALAWVALRVFGYGDVPLLGVFLLGLGVVGFVMTRKSRTESRGQFDADAGVPLVSRPAAGAAPASAE
jgi:hypothetical protein